MQKFTNEAIDLDNLPTLDKIVFNKLHDDYWKIILFNISLLSLVIVIAVSIIVIKHSELFAFYPYIVVAIFFAVTILFVINRVSYRKKGYAFRSHDVIFRSGILANSTMVIPYNRVQHIALHEGILSRHFGLAAIEIFTAGGDSSDITIPGIEKQQAESIKQLLMNKIKTNN